ncbi:transmembrane protein 229B-like isoform X2 [Genypterus blacodes]|uniref:transmembrane protein 229B-like isoform X2 n=1 Tax=Genypterus blacodes TaxID=154954 RepID=UPI003F76175B
MFSQGSTHAHTHTYLYKQASRRITGLRGSICCTGTGDDDEALAEPHGASSCDHLPALVRLYVYALHGLLCEVAFTALCDWFSTQDRRLVGHSSLWALPMYATAIYVMESLRAKLLALHHSLPVRLITYTLFIYLWEFSWGVGLRLMGACPWDYSAYRYNLGGLVTLEYALPWGVASLIVEKHVIRSTLRIRLDK